MFAITESINLIRYLIVLRPRHKLVQLPEHFTVDISEVLGATISAQLPTREAHDWQRTRELWAARYYHPSQQSANLLKENALTHIPASPWPIDAAIVPYLTKHTYGEGEAIAWELKLFGAAADHGFFLEHILTALEARSTQPPVDLPAESKWLWGNYRVSDVYAAQGARWMPLVEAGQLSLDYYPTPLQWQAGETWYPSDEAATHYRWLIWLTPFDLGPEPYILMPKSRRRKKKIARRDVPTIEGIIHALMARVAQIMLDKHATADDAWALIPADEQAQLWEALNKLQQRPHIQSAKMNPPPKGCFGQWIGNQKFTTHVPEIALPYLQLASILHIGHHTHFGCGTFILR